MCNAVESTNIGVGVAKLALPVKASLDTPSLIATALPNGNAARLFRSFVGRNCGPAAYCAAWGNGNFGGIRYTALSPAFCSLLPSMAMS